MVVRKASSVSTVPPPCPSASADRAADRPRSGHRGPSRGELIAVTYQACSLAIALSPQVQGSWGANRSTRWHRTGRFGRCGPVGVGRGRGHGRLAHPGKGRPTVVGELKQRWRDHDLALSRRPTGGGGRRLGGAGDPWEGAVNTVRDLAPELAGKIVVSMVNAMAGGATGLCPCCHRRARSLWPCPRRCRPAGWPGRSTTCRPGPLGDPDHELGADVMVFSDGRAGDRRGHRPGQPGTRPARGRRGGLGSALAVEALTAALVEVNRRYKTHASLRVTGIE